MYFSQKLYKLINKVHYNVRIIFVCFLNDDIKGRHYLRHGITSRNCEHSTGQSATAGVSSRILWRIVLLCACKMALVWAGRKHVASTCCVQLSRKSSATEQNSVRLGLRLHRSCKKNDLVDNLIVKF